MHGFEEIVEVVFDVGANLPDIFVQPRLPAAITQATGELHQGLAFGDQSFWGVTGLSGVGFLGSNLMMLYLWIRDHRVRRVRGNLGHGSGSQVPSGRGVCRSSATKIVIQPRRKILPTRRRVARRWRRWWPSVAVTSRSVRAGIASSAAPPTLSRHRVATATASHSRAARSGWVMRVRCHGQPARLMHVHGGAIQARRPYQPASLASGGKSVRISQGSVPLCPAGQQVHRSCRCQLLQAVPGPRQRVPGCGAQLAHGRSVACGSGRHVPPRLRRNKGCQPNRTRRRNNHPADSPRSARTITVQGRGKPAAADATSAATRGARPGAGWPAGWSRPPGWHSRETPP